MPDLASLFDGFQCPEATPCPPVVLDVCGTRAWEIELKQPPGALDATVTITVSCGEHLEGEVIKGCLKVSAVNTDVEGLVSPDSSQLSFGGAGCQPVPEPGFGLALLVGILWLAIVRKRKGQGVAKTLR